MQRTSGKYIVVLWIFLLVKEGMNAFSGDGIPDYPSCMSDRDSFGLEWNATNNGQTIIMECPEGSSGNISRECIVMDDLDTTWLHPNVECTNDLIRDSAMLAKGALNEGSVGLADINSLLSTMHAVTYGAFVNGTFFPADFITCADILLDVSTSVGHTKDIEHVGVSTIESLVQAYADTVDGLVDQSTFHVWRSFFVTYDLVKTATELLQSTEMLAINILQLRLTSLTPASEDPAANSSFAWTRVSATAENLDIELCILSDERAISMQAPDGSSSIIYPPDFITHVNNSGVIGLYRAQFQSISQLFNDEEMRPPVTWLVRDPITSPARPLSSVILSAKVITNPLLDIEHLSASTDLPYPVTLIFKHNNQPDPGYRASCYYLNETAVLFDEPSRRWSSDGCETIDSNLTHTTCRCYHLTSFALIMDLYEVTVAGVHQVALEYLSYVGGALSIAGCLLSVITYKLCKLTNERIYIHEMLAMSIVATQMTFFVGFERTENRSVCRVFAILLHFSVVAMFSWMLIEGIHLYISLVKVFRRGPLFKKYCCFGFGLPLINVTISLAIFYDQYAVEEYCWLSNEVLFITFIPFVIITVLVNCIVLAVTLRVIVRSKKNAVRSANEDISSIKVGLKATVVLLPLLGITWFFGFISTGHDATLIFTYLFTICNSMQGVFFYGFHCLMNAELFGFWAVSISGLLVAMVQASLKRLWISANGSNSSAGSGVNSEGQHQPVDPAEPGADGNLSSQQPICFFVTRPPGPLNNVNEQIVDSTISSVKDCELYLHKDLPPPPAACCHQSAVSLDSVTTDVTSSECNESDSPPPYTETVFDDYGTMPTTQGHE